MKQKVRTRFAPSPTGFLHVGGLRTALYCYLYARKNKGDFILRIEDTDLERQVEGAVDIIYETLKKANMKVDEGPLEGGKYGPYIQTERKGLYLGYAEELIEKGAAYYCFCDKERLSSLKNKNGVARYDKHCLHLSKQEIEEKKKQGIPWVIRQNMPTEGSSTFIDLVYGEVTIPNNELEDQVLIKSDGLPTYNFANVIDDHLMKINYVMRGNEYLSSTPKYNLLYDAFGWDRPNYVHLTPIMKDETRKLSKRYGDANFNDFINKGFLPEAIINYIALLGWSPKGEKELFTMDELVDAFSFDGLSKSKAIFDIDKLKWMNSEYIKKLDFGKFIELATPFFDKSNIKDKYSYEKFGKLVQSRIEVFSDIPDMVNFITEFSKIDNDMYFNKRFKVNAEKAKELLKTIILDFNNCKWDEDSLHEATSNVAKKLEVKAGAIYTVMRIALTNAKVTPGGSVEMMDILGKEESMVRLNKAMEWLNE